MGNTVQSLDGGRGGIGVRLRGVRRVFPVGGHSAGVTALDGIDLDVRPGEFVAILGPSGCGKSTLLRLIAGLDRPDEGTVQLADMAGTKTPSPQPSPGGRGGGEAPSPQPSPSEGRGGLAYVFQDAHLLPWRDVLGNVALPLELMGVPRAVRREAAGRAVEQVGLTEAASRYPAQLSGGMKMRVSLARALVTDPRLLLLDEPFAALDEITRQGLDEQLRGLWRQRGITVLFVTHSIGEAAFLAQRAVVLTPRPARVVIDHALDLPDERTGATRATPGFARQTGILYDALQRGGA
jgi:NitT/TauT family transport system ATP-binding protein